MPMDQPGPLPVFLSKILLELSQVSPFLSVYCSYCAIAGQSGVAATHAAWPLKPIHGRPGPSEESLPTSVSDH